MSTAIGPYPLAYVKTYAVIGDTPYDVLHALADFAEDYLEQNPDGEEPTRFVTSVQVQYADEGQFEGIICLEDTSSLDVDASTGVSGEEFVELLSEIQPAAPSVINIHVEGDLHL